MNFNKKQIKEIIQQEIDWYLNNEAKATMPEDWVQGFIAGLKHLKKLFNLIKDNK